jgi:hypothetical protein
MEAFLWFMAIWGIPLWFTFRLWYFTNKRTGTNDWLSIGFDGVSKGFSVFFVLLLSWLGFWLTVAITNVTKSDVAQTFFLPVREKSMASKMFWYKMRVLALRFLFIKES